MSKSTVVSTLPFKLIEPKPGLIPSIYEIAAAPRKGEVGITVIDDGYHLVLIPLTDSKAPPMKVADLSNRIAESLINDYVSSCLAVEYTPNEKGAIAMPGLFWVDGEKSSTDILTKYKGLVEKYTSNTIAWFERLVKLADDDWSKNHMHKTITDLQRKACNYLKQNIDPQFDREWNFDVFQTLSSLCWACKSQVNPQAIICPSCNAVINKVEFEKRKLDFAKV